MRLLFLGSLYLCALVHSTLGWMRDVYDPVQMLCLVNEERVKVGLLPLAIHPALEQAAQEHSQTQADRGQMTHDDPKGRSLGTRITEAGYASWHIVGENVAEGYKDEETCMTAWMNSEGHRHNILNPKFTHFGSAVAWNDMTPYYTQEFLGDGEEHSFPVCPKKEHQYNASDSKSSYSTHDTAKSSKTKKRVRKVKLHKKKKARKHKLSHKKAKKHKFVVSKPGQSYQIVSVKKIVWPKGSKTYHQKIIVASKSGTSIKLLRQNSKNQSSNDSIENSHSQHDGNKDSSNYNQKDHGHDGNKKTKKRRCKRKKKSKKVN